MSTIVQTDMPRVRDGAMVIQGWLIVLGLMVYAMILVGGATRLTDSGLSITEWRPVTGALPPLSDAAWQLEFDKYRATAEYQSQNRGMSMSAFQFIYWWEWGHRQLGRLIGLFAVGGFVLFAAKRWLTRPLATRLGILIALGGLQGFIGWWMVASGIGETTRVDVAPYRLMTHLCLALLIIAMIFWTWLDLSDSAQRQRTGAAARWTAILFLTLTGVQLASGALVAGLDAGRSYTDWPLMHDEVFPSDYWMSSMGVQNFFENRATVQFNHRTLGYVLWGLSLFSAIAFRRSALAKAFVALAVITTAQAIWGIWTLVSAAPLNLALVHQGLGVVLLLAAVWSVWASRPGQPALRRQSI